MIAALEDAGLEVPRQGKGYVTVRNPVDGKRWRLKAALCTSMTSNRRDLTSRLQRRLETERAEIEATAARAEAAWRELARRREQRAAYHRGRYGGGDRADAPDAPARVGPAPTGRPEPLARHLRRELGSDALAVDGHRVGVVRAVQDGTAAALRAAAAALRGSRSLTAAHRAAGRGERDLPAARRAALRATDVLARALQGARRDVAPALALTRQRDFPETHKRDPGPSR